MSDAQLQSASFLVTKVGLTWIAALIVQLLVILWEVDVVGWFWADPALELTQEKAGSYLRKKNDVRFQWSNDLVWNSASDEKQIYFDQSILTLEESTAVVKLDSGIELELPERSMIAIRRPTRIDDDLVTLLSLGRGRINVRKIPNKVQVRLPKNQGKITLEKGSSADISLVRPVGELPGDKVKVRVDLHEGQASIEKKNEREEFKKGQYFLEIDRNKIQITPHAVETPVVEPVKPKVIEPVKPKAKVQRKRAPKPKFTPKLTPEPKAKPKSKPKPPARPDAPSRFNDPKFKTEITLPPTTIVITLLNFFVSSAVANEADGVPVVLSWDEVKDASSYEIQVARTRAFHKILGEGKTSVNRWEWTYRRGVENTKGRVFYRVRSISKDGVVGRYSAPVALPIPDEVRFGKKKEEKIASQSEPVSQPEPVPVQEAKVEDPNQKWEFAVGWGYHAFKSTQKSSSDLVLANMQFPSQSQGIEIDVKRVLSNLSYRLNLQGYLINIQGQGTIAATQPDLKVIEGNARFYLVRESRFWIWDDLGIVGRRSVRFTRVSPAEVSAPAGWSIGFSGERRFGSRAQGMVRFELLPFGLVMGGPGALQVQSTYQVFSFNIGMIKVIGEPAFNYRFEYWKEPTRTRIHAASLGFHLTGQI